MTEKELIDYWRRMMTVSAFSSLPDWQKMSDALEDFESHFHAALELTGLTIGEVDVATVSLFGGKTSAEAERVAGAMRDAIRERLGLPPFGVRRARKHNRSRRNEAKPRNH